MSALVRRVAALPFTAQLIALIVGVSVIIVLPSLWYVNHHHAERLHDATSIVQRACGPQKAVVFHRIEDGSPSTIDHAYEWAKNCQTRPGS